MAKTNIHNLPFSPIHDGTNHEVISFIKSTIKAEKTIKNKGFLPILNEKKKPKTVESAIDFIIMSEKISLIHKLGQFVINFAHELNKYHVCENLKILLVLEFVSKLEKIKLSDVELESIRKL